MTATPLVGLAVLVAIALGLAWLLTPRGAGPTGARLRAPAELAIATLLCAYLVSAGSAGRIAPGWAVAGAIGAVLLVGWRVLADYVTGVVLASEGRLQVGDQVRFEGGAGVVRAIGRRVCVIEGGSGTLLVPHTVLARAVVERRRPSEGQDPHAFELRWGPEHTHRDVARQVRDTALLHPSGVAGREPRVEPTGPRSARVTVYAPDMARAYEIERAIRDVLGSP